MPNLAASNESSGHRLNNEESQAISGNIEWNVVKRETWVRKFDFLLACIGASVGLGNVWRFPFLCYRNGGGTFLIPYILTVVFAGVPLCFLEASLGQFMSEGGIGPFKICPLFQGIGVATTGIIFVLNCSYNVILGWAFYYLFSSFAAVLPWSNCDNAWNTPECSLFNQRTFQNNSFANSSSTDSTRSNPPFPYTVINTTLVSNTEGKQLFFTNPATEFWERKVLNLSEEMDTPGNIKWDLALCLLLAWIVMYLCIWKGIKMSIKVIYATATCPYILMIVLLIRGVTLDGSSEGITYYLFPDVTRLQDFQVWTDAGTQVIFSYAIGLGVLPVIGSYNTFRHNVLRDTICFAVVNGVTSFLAGFITFSVLGFMAKQQGVSIAEVAESGPGLAFIAYPEAVAQLPLAPVWSVLFFLMIIMLGIDTQLAGIETFITAIVDIYPRVLRKAHGREVFSFIVCTVCYLIGLPMVTDGGMYVFQLFDFYPASRITIIVAFLECVVVTYIYGVNRFYDNLEMMLGFRLNLFMKICWILTTPVLTFIIFILSTISYSELKYKRTTVTYEYPGWAIAVGWILASVPVSLIPAVMIKKILETKGSFVQRLKYLIRPRLKRHQIRANENLDTIEIIDGLPSQPDVPIDTEGQENLQIIDTMIVTRM